MSSTTRFNPLQKTEEALAPLKPILDIDLKTQVFFDEQGFPVDCNFCAKDFEESLSPINPTLSLDYHSLGTLEKLFDFYSSSLEEISTPNFDGNCQIS
jgi:hypothetical protein